MHMTERPLIAITTGGEKRLPRQPDLYLQALEGAGASAVFIEPDAGIMETVESYSGFLLPGGRDIDPLLYNEQSITDMDLEDRKRVDFDLALFHSAARQGKPILGICYGMQLINVATGGTLYQDIETQKKGGTNHRVENHQIEVNDNPFIKSGRYEVNSGHHQAVKDTGRGLNAFAFAPDGVIEAFYSPEHRFLLGVQWHPERMRNGLSENVFTSFIEACRERK